MINLNCLGSTPLLTAKLKSDSLFCLSPLKAYAIDLLAKASELLLSSFIASENDISSKIPLLFASVNFSPSS